MMMRSDFSTLLESKGEIISYGDMPISDHDVLAL
jgi:hypothetical protein